MSIDHTEDSEVELPLVEDEVAETGSESVETFDEALDSAETDEDFAAIADGLREEVEPAEDSNEEQKNIDTKTEEDTTSDFSIGKGFAIKDGDIELTITDEAKLRQLAQMGLNYGGKTTELAKHRSFIKYAEEHNISMEDVQMLNDIKSGNKDAYSALAKNAGINVYDITEEHSYVPEPINIAQEPDPMVDAIASEILSNEEHTKQFQTWLPKMPDSVQQQVTSDANALRAVQADIQSGIFNDAMERAYYDVRVNGAEFNSAYIQAKEMLIGTKTPATEPRRTITRGERVRAASPRGRSSAPSKTYGAISDMSNDEFLENFNDIISGLERPQ